MDQKEKHFLERVDEEKGTSKDGTLKGKTKGKEDE